MKERIKPKVGLIKVPSPAPNWANTGDSDETNESIGTCRKNTLADYQGSYPAKMAKKVCRVMGTSSNNHSWYECSDIRSQSD